MLPEFTSKVTGTEIRMPEFHCDEVFPNSIPERAKNLNLDLSNVSIRLIPSRLMKDLTAKEDNSFVNKHEFFLTYNNETDTKTLQQIAKRSEVLKSLFEFFVEEFSDRLVDITMRGKNIVGRIKLTAVKTVLTEDEAADMILFSAHANPFNNKAHL